MTRLHIQLEPQQPIRLSRLDHAREYPAQILDLNAETLIVRVPTTLQAGEVPERVALTVGYSNHNWRAETDVYAHFEDWWFLRRPGKQDFTTSQRRQNVRIIYEDDLLLIPVDARGLPTGTPCEIKLRNLSVTGCYGYVPRRLQNGDRAMIIVSLSDMPIISAISRVVRVQKHVQNDAGWYGFLFENLTMEQEENIARHVHQLIAISLKAGVDITAD